MNLENIFNKMVIVMTNKEILDKYIELINKGYCDDCNNLNCIDNFPHKKIAKAIEELQKENKLLKELKAKIIDGDDDIELEYDLGDYLCSIDCCLGQNHEICELKKKIKKLKQEKKQLKEQLHQCSLDIQELTERDIECPSYCDKLKQRDEVIGKAIGHINVCGKELSNDECRYLLDILNKYKNIGD